jgi:hypothetical protein
MSTRASGAKAGLVLARAGLVLGAEGGEGAAWAEEEMRAGAPINRTASAAARSVNRARESTE